MSSPELRNYQGNCHCGAVKFTVDIPEVKKASTCNCSICSRKGYYWVFPGAGDFKIESGEETLVNYEFGNKTMAHRFCPTCGTAVMGQRYSAPPGRDIGVNVRTLKGVDPFTVEVGTFDGAALEPVYAPKAFPGPLPTVSGDDLKLYTGSCHCGAFSVAVKTKPLSEVELNEDNCSICSRNGAAWLRLPRPNFAFDGVENTTLYQFGSKSIYHHFCKTCGVPVYVETSPETGEGDFLQVNARVLNGVEWDKVKIKRDDCGSKGYVVV